MEELVGILQVMNGLRTIELTKITMYKRFDRVHYLSRRRRVLKDYNEK
jgi:hypothetical protein